MYWKYFDECFMDKNLLHISLTKFNKLNKRRKHTFLITQFYLCFIFSFHFQYIFSLSFSGLLDLHLFPYNVFDLKSKKCVVNCMCWQLETVCFYMITFIFNVVTLIFCVLAEQESNKKWSKLANVTPTLENEALEIQPTLTNSILRKLLL